MKRLVGYFLVIFFTLNVSAPLAHSAVTPGTKCPKVSMKQVYKGKTYTCIKLGKRLFWNNGVKLSITKPTPVPTPSPLNTPDISVLESPSPTVESTPDVFPVLSNTYYGQKGVSSIVTDCWFAKKASNPSKQISIASRQESEVVGPDGTVKGTTWWMIPSLLPGETIWLANSPYRQYYLCNEPPSRIIEKEITKFGYSSSERITSADEHPKVLGIVQVPEVGSTWIKFKLKVKNQSLEKYIVQYSLTYVNFVFLNAKGIPIWALSGNISGDVPPNSEALLSSGLTDTSLPSIPQGTSSIVGSLNFVLCKADANPYSDICSH